MKIQNFLRVKTLDILRGIDQYSIYKQYLKNQFIQDYYSIRHYWDDMFQYIFSYHFNHNLSYRDYILNINDSINVRSSIENIPIITKNYFRKNELHSIKKNSAITKHSGGSSGQPLTYFLSKQSYQHIWPSLWRAFDVYGVKPTDRLMMIAGLSLYNNRSISRRIYDFINNFTIISAFDLNEETLFKAYNVLNKQKVTSIYGYTSAILVLLEYLQANNKYLKLKVIYTTSETFIPSIRNLAREYCNCDVIDTYGANDGGISSFECQYHTGYHINYERTMVEIVDGRIILTDLLNTASPFIRYEVGDTTDSLDLNFDKCPCGRYLPRLLNISGRISDCIEDYYGNKIHTEFFTHLFSADNSIKQFQVIDNNNQLLINIITDDNQEHLLNIYESLVKRKIKRNFKIVFNFQIKKLKNGKTPILFKEKLNDLV